MESKVLQVHLIRASQSICCGGPLISFPQWARTVCLYIGMGHVSSHLINPCHESPISPPRGRLEGHGHILIHIPNVILLESPCLFSSGGNMLQVTSLSSKFFKWPLTSPSIPLPPPPTSEACQCSLAFFPSPWSASPGASVHFFLFCSRPFSFAGDSQLRLPDLSLKVWERCSTQCLHHQTFRLFLSIFYSPFSLSSSLPPFLLIPRFHPNV